MWCKQREGDDLKYENQKRYNKYSSLYRRTQNGTLWVRRPKTPPKEVLQQDQNHKISLSKFLKTNIKSKAQEVICEINLQKSIDKMKKFKGKLVSNPNKLLITPIDNSKCN